MAKKATKMSEEQRDSLEPPMVARFEVNDLGSPVVQKKITDALEAIDGVSEVTIALNAVHVRYDPIEISEKRLRETIQHTGASVKAMVPILRRRIRRAVNILYHSRTDYHWPPVCGSFQRLVRRPMNLRV
jgi:copper chaperone CopZ